MSEISREANRATVRPDGELAASAASRLRGELCQLVGSDVRDLEFDLTNVDAINVIGIAVLAAAHNSLSRVGGRIRVTNVSKDIHKLFRFMNLAQHFEVAGTQIPKKG
jgi:anti-anti-sigma factor